jgi:Fuc2NAc and GlcNAc transferase
MLSDILRLIAIFFSTLLLTGVVRHYALSRELLDVPNERSSHNLPTPRGGGVAIVTVFLVALILSWMLGRVDGYFVLAVAGSGILVAAMGFWDDHGHIPQQWRLLAHFVAALWALFWLEDDLASGVLAFPFDIVWFRWLLASVFLVWVLNLFNFMDGIDGIAGSEGVFISSAAAFLLWVSGADDGGASVVFAALSASVLGFLVWNWPPAKIFMGDVGSGFLGCILGVMAYASMSEVSFWSWLILFGVFVVDATVTLVRRILRGDRWYEAHRSHAYQWASRRWGHLKVTIVVSVINCCWLLPMALIAHQYPKWAAEVAVFALLPLIIAAGVLGAGKPEDEAVTS